MTKIKLKETTNTVLVYKWMCETFGSNIYDTNWQIVTYASLTGDTTYLEISDGEPAKITFAIIRWSSNEN